MISFIVPGSRIQSRPHMIPHHISYMCVCVCVFHWDLLQTKRCFVLLRYFYRHIIFNPSAVFYLRVHSSYVDVVTNITMNISVEKLGWFWAFLICHLPFFFCIFYIIYLCLEKLGWLQTFYFVVSIYLCLQISYLNLNRNLVSGKSDIDLVMIILTLEENIINIYE